MKETLSQCIQAAENLAASHGYEIPHDEFSPVVFGGIRYGESRRLSLALITKKGNVARKCLQFQVSRPALNEPNAGRYNLNMYIL